MLIKMLIKKACKSDWVLKLIKRCFFQLTLLLLYISESCIEIKINLNFCFPTFLCCLKRFYESLVKPFEAQQRSVKIKI